MISLEPIGVFHCQSKYPYEARRQASIDASQSMGEIHLNSGQNFEQALQDLDGFERIWILYQFHHNRDWKPMVMPPRGPRIKRGLFATRAPYRPNQIGISCVRLVKIQGLAVIVEGHDLLDQTPVLDIKPYISYADAFVDSKMGWLEGIEQDRWAVEFTAHAETQLNWLEERGMSQLRGFIQGQLEFDPFDGKRKRIQSLENEGLFALAYRTWRVDYVVNTEAKSVRVKLIRTGYSQQELTESLDTYQDKELHRQFEKQMQQNFIARRF